MAIFTLSEVFDIFVMTLIVGYIFSGTFRKPVEHDYDPLKHYKHGFYGINWEDFKLSVLVTVPAIIFHELGHKFVALGFGLEAQFHAAWTFLALGLAMKLLNFGFIFVVPAYVSILGNPTNLQSSMVAFAGPAVNLILWLGSLAMLNLKSIPKKYYGVLLLTSKINMFLFIFNMLPIPGFDGSKVFMGLIQAFL